MDDLTPANWSHKKVTEYFNVSEYVVWEAQALVREEGIISPKYQAGQDHLEQNSAVCEALL